MYVCVAQQIVPTNRVSPVVQTNQIQYFTQTVNSEYIHGITLQSIQFVLQFSFGFQISASNRLLWRIKKRHSMSKVKKP